MRPIVVHKRVRVGRAWSKRVTVKCGRILLVGRLRMEREEERVVTDAEVRGLVVTLVRPKKYRGTGVLRDHLKGAWEGNYLFKGASLSLWGLEWVKSTLIRLYRDGREKMGKKTPP